MIEEVIIRFKRDSERVINVETKVKKDGNEIYSNISIYDKDDEFVRVMTNEIEIADLKLKGRGR